MDGGIRLGVLAFAVGVAAALLAGLPGCKQEPGAQGGKVRVVATTPDIGAIASAVGGDAVEVKSFVKPGDDPHVLEANTQMVETLARAQLLVAVGLHVEDAWLPTMLKTAGNAAIVPGATGYVALAKTARLIGDEEPKEGAKAGEKPAGKAQSFHPEENPHFLLDPVEGVKAARVIAKKLAELEPKEAEAIDKRYKGFAKAVMEAQLGQALADRLSPDEFEAVSMAIESGGLKHYLEQKKITGVELGGLEAQMLPYKKAQLVGDHDLWPYFARRYGVEMLGYIEGDPGSTPTANHLTDLIAQMKAAKCVVVLRAPYFDPKQTRFVADSAGGKVVQMAHFPGSRPGTESYVNFIEYNAKQLSEALKTAKP